MRPPAFAFYVKDWLAGTRHLTFAQKGVYIDLLAWSWENGPLPFRVADLARILGTNATQMRIVWPVLCRQHFTRTPIGYVNRRLEVERAKSKAFKALQAEKARRSWAVRRSRGMSRGSSSAYAGDLLALASASADLDQVPSAPPERPEFAPFKVYCAIAGCAIDEPPATGDLGEIRERVKTICARADIPCDGETARKAIDAVIVGRSKRRA